MTDNARSAAQQPPRKTADEISKLPRGAWCAGTRIVAAGAVPTARLSRLFVPFLAAVLLVASAALVGAHPALAQGVDTGPVSGSPDQIKGAIDKLVLWGLTLAGSVAAVGILWGAGLLITSGSNKDRHSSGLRAIGKSVLGFLVCACVGGILALSKSFVG